MKRLVSVLSMALVLAAALAQAQLSPVPQDQGSVGLALALRQLGSAATFMHTTAHPDDEDNGLLVMMSRGRGLRTALLTVTRGDGGQNEIGPEIFQAIGILRTGELMAMHRQDAAEQYFTSAFEFGYSFSVEETLEKWGEEEILADIEIPEHLRQFHYLDPLYDRPEFIARNVIRKYGGWWDGFSSNVLPATMADRAKEISALAGGASALIARATELTSTDPKLACHLAEWAALAEPRNPKAHQCVIDVFKNRAEDEISLMGRGILSHAARKSEKALALLDADG